MTSLAVAGICIFFWQAATLSAFERFAKEFTAAYAEMDPDPYVLEFRDRLGNIPSEKILLERQFFFKEQHEQLRQLRSKGIEHAHKAEAALIEYLITRHQQQLKLEVEWSKAGRSMPMRGLEGVPMRQDWYQWLIERYTSTKISPGEVKAMGHQEIARCKEQLERLSRELGFSSNAEFQSECSSNRSQVTDKDELIGHFDRLDSVVRSRLPDFVVIEDPPSVQPMEWPGAGANTPPGIYLSKEYNPYGTDVFQFNFYNNTFNLRNLGWLYMHEAIPGHHLQSSIRRAQPHTDLRAHLVEGGNFEGWACYVEYLGDGLGVYDDPWQEVGKWEWDLVRSTRLVLDVGIHHEGWSRDEALRFWRNTIPGQDAIAEREVDRVTAMPGQVLSYKVGAAKIEELKRKYLQADEERSAKDFHMAFLMAGQVPLEIMAYFL